MNTKSEEKKERPMRYSDKELSLIKNTFAENDALIMAIRKALLGAKLSKGEQAFVDSLTEDAFGVVKKTLTPQIDVDAPLFQITDLWLNINTKESGLEKTYIDIRARKIVEDYMTGMLGNMRGNAGSGGITLESLKYVGTEIAEDAVVNLSARNTILTHIDFQLFQIKTLAGQKDETVDQTKLRLSKDSAK